MDPHSSSENKSCSQSRGSPQVSFTELDTQFDEVLDLVEAAGKELICSNVIESSLFRSSVSKIAAQAIELQNLYATFMNWLVDIINNSEEYRLKMKAIDMGATPSLIESLRRSISVLSAEFRSADTYLKNNMPIPKEKDCLRNYRDLAIFWDLVQACRFSEEYLKEKIEKFRSLCKGEIQQLSEQIAEKLEDTSQHP